MESGARRRRLLGGLLIFALSWRGTRCAEHPTVVIDEPPLRRGSERTLNNLAWQDAKTARSLESVASAIRRDNASPKKERIQRQRRRRQQRDLIVGGTAAPPGRFPYVVSLQMEKILDDAASAANGGDTVSDIHTCGGTLIAMDVVLTAGHCGYEEVPSAQVTGSQGSVNAEGHVNFGEMPQQIFYGADVGAYNLSSYDAGGYTVDNMLFEKLVLHPDYTGFHGKGNSRMSLQHDIMLVKLYGESDQPVVKVHNPKLSEKAHRNPKEGDDLVVTGWGDTDPIPGEESTRLASILHAATVSYVPNDICEDSKGYSSISSSATSENYFEYDGTISDDMMCAIGKARQDACQGDSGGGLIRLGSDFHGSEDVQMGIVSWGLECGDSDFPGVYSRVGEHYDWIEENICELSDSPPSWFDCAPKFSPPGSPYDPVVDLTITIRFDDYRSETAWLLESIPDFRNIAYRPFGTYTSTTSVDENNAMSEIVQVHSGRFYMLSILDEFADGFCCTVGEGYFRVDSSVQEYPVVETTPGILWSPHALRRSFYVSPPDTANPPNYVTIVVTLGAGADPGKFLLVGLENVAHEALMLYEIRPFVLINDSRTGAGTMVYSRTFRQVPVFGPEYGRHRYNVIVYDDNDGAASKASFQVYNGDAHPDNLLLSQSGNYGDKNNISRSFVLFKDRAEGADPSRDPALFIPTGDAMNAATMNSGGDSVLSFALILTAVAIVLG